MTGAGGIIFDNLPMIFALGVAIGLAGGDGVAANYNTAEHTCL
jgi:phosphotransferase system  glucose/maltose/N-acetylglucosamine-specific IIC component